MKKIIALLSILLIAPSAMAIIYTEDTSNPAFLQNKGYSQTLIRAIDTEKSHVTGSENTYVKYYKEKSAFSDKPETIGEFFSSLYTKAKVYLDPIQDDGHFTEREIKFSNDWYPELPTQKQKKVENL